jgi:hypothetical protein
VKRLFPHIIRLDGSWIFLTKSVVCFKVSVLLYIFSVMLVNYSAARQPLPFGSMPSNVLACPGFSATQGVRHHALLQDTVAKVGSTTFYPYHQLPTVALGISVAPGIYNQKFKIKGLSQEYSAKHLHIHSVKPHCSGSTPTTKCASIDQICIWSIGQMNCRKAFKSQILIFSPTVHLMQYTVA